MSRADASALPPILIARPTPVALLRAAARRWPLTLAVAGLLGCAAAFGLWRFTPLRHNAEVRLRVRPAPAGIADKNADAAAELRTQADLITDPLVLAHAAANPDLANLASARGWAAPAEKIAAAVRVEAIPSDSAVRIRVADEGAAEAAVVARAVVNGYLTELKSRRVRYVQQLKDALAREPADVVKATPDPVPTPTPTPARVGDDPRLVAAETKLAQVRADRRKALGELLALQEGEATRTGPAVSEAAVNQAFQNDDFVQQKQRELKPIQDVIDRTLRIAVLREKEPSLKPYLVRRDAILQDLAARRTAIQKGLEQQARVKSSGPDLQPQIKAVQERADGLARQEQALKAEIESLREDAAKVVAPPAPPPPPPVVRVDPPVDSESRLKLEADLRQAQAQGMEPYWVTSLGEKTILDADSVARRQTAAGVGGAAGILLGVLFVGFAEFRSRRVRAARDVAEGLGVPVFGALPRLTATAKTLVEPGKDGEAVDVLGARLLAAVPAGPCVILVTGSDGEGKSALATHLAASLARSWHKTVLIDADPRRSDLQRVLLLAEGPGLAGVLRGEAEPLDALEVTELNRLWVMPAGRPDAASAQALALGAGAALAALKEQFDCVVVNAAGPGTTGDALLLAPSCDAVLLAVEVGVSRLPAVHAARRQIEGAGGAVVGAAVLGAAGEAVGEGSHVLPLAA